MWQLKSDKLINDNLQELFDTWVSLLKNNGFSTDDFIPDGIYPYYTHQNIKILFVGRECLGLTGDSYITELHNAYKDKTVGGRPLNSCRFHALMFYIVWGMNNGFPEWDSLPMATEIVEDFSTDKGISFAFMNLSKFSNNSESWKADWSLIDSFIDASKHHDFNLFNKEIEIINPDIIICMNLNERLSHLGERKIINETSNENISCQSLLVNDKYIPLFDMYHFSAFKNKRTVYYEPLRDALKKLSL